MAANYDWYNIAKDRGSMVGQGLMAAGNLYASNIKEQKLEKKQEEEKDAAKTLSMMNIYMKMTEKMTPEDSSKFLSATVPAMLAKAGAIPEGMTKEDMGRMLGMVAISTPQEKQAFMSKSNEVIDLISKNDMAGASKKLNEMKVTYGQFDWGKKVFEGLEKQMTTKEGQTKESDKFKREQSAKVDELITKGEATEIPSELKAIFDSKENFTKYRELIKSQGIEMSDDEAKTAWEQGKQMLSKMVGKSPVVSDFAGTGRGLIGVSPEQKLQKKLEETKVIEGAKADIQLNKSKKLEDYKKEIKKTAGIDLTDAQLLNAFEEADKAFNDLTDSALLNNELKQKISAMSESDIDEWKVDWVKKNIENVKNIKHPDNNDPLGIR